MRSLDNSFFHAILELKQQTIHSPDKRAADFWARLVASQSAFVDRSSVQVRFLLEFINKLSVEYSLRA